MTELRTRCQGAAPEGTAEGAAPDECIIPPDPTAIVYRLLMGDPDALLSVTELVQLYKELQNPLHVIGITSLVQNLISAQTRVIQRPFRARARVWRVRGALQSLSFIAFT